MFIVSRVRRPVTRHHVCVKNVRCAAGACYPISGFSSRLARRQFPCVVRPPTVLVAYGVRLVARSHGGCASTKKRIHTGYREKRKRKEVDYTAPRGWRSDTPTCMWMMSSPHARVTRRVPVDHTRTRAPSATGEAQRRTIVEPKTHAQLTRR